MLRRAWTARRLRAETTALLRGAAEQLHGRDVALIAAGLTFYAGIAVVPLLLVAFSLTALLTSAERVRELGDRLAQLLPPELGAPGALRTLADAGTGLDLLGFVLALLPLTFYGEGLRRALLRFTPRQDRLTGWRGRLRRSRWTRTAPTTSRTAPSASSCSSTIRSDVTPRGSPTR